MLLRLEGHGGKFCSQIHHLLYFCIVRPDNPGVIAHRTVYIGLHRQGQKVFLVLL